jgi:hypothetical protein
MDWIIVGTTIVATQAAGLATAWLVLSLVVKVVVPAARSPLGDGARLIYTPNSDNSA